MRALILNCTLKASRERSNTEALLDVVAEAMRGDDIDVDVVRVVDHDVEPGVTNDEGGGDEWRAILSFVRNAEILVIATPTWLGQPSSVAKRVLERMDALISETDGGRPFAFHRVGGIVVTGNEDGAHPCDRRGCAVAHRHRLHRARSGVDLLEHGTGPGPSYLETDHEHDWSEKTAPRQGANTTAASVGTRVG